MISHTSIDDLDPQPVPGVYFLYLKNRDALPLSDLPEDGLIYIGSAANLAERLLGGHFCDGQTGHSTIRRTLGAILKEQLKLRAIPREPGSSDDDCTHYRFTDDSERSLTQWMRENLEACVSPLDEDWRKAEKRLIAELQPSLCLKGWPNPRRRPVKDLRKLCVDEARGIDSDHGDAH